MNYRTFFYSAFFLIILVNLNLFGQSQAALPFLTYPVSPANIGMGSVGTSLPTDDALAFLFNPAQLGHTSKSNNITFQFYPGETDLYNNNASLNAIAVNIGYNFYKLLDFPISFGIGYDHTSLEYNFFGISDSYNAFSVGIGINYLVEVDLGYTYKDITSELSPESFNTQMINTKFSAYDLGILLNVPVSSLLFDNTKINVIKEINIKPVLNFAAGYAQSNIGDKVYYIDPAQADPYPRTARLGYSLTGVLQEKSMKIPLDLVYLDFTVEAEDYLINRDTVSHFSYQSGFGDIDIGKNILGIRGDDNVTTYAGIRVELLETADLLFGHLGNSGSLYKTNGYGIRLKGLLKILAENSESKEIEFIARHFDVRYYSANSLIGSAFEPSFSAVELVFSNFIFE